MDCKITENFLSEWYRLCKSKAVGCEACATCKMWFLDKEQSGCKASVMKDLQRAIEIVQRWSDEHPQRTILMDFIEKHPKAPYYNGYPRVCPYFLGYRTDCQSDDCPQNEQDCRKCWDTPISD